MNVRVARKRRTYLLKTAGATQAIRKAGKQFRRALLDALFRVP